jgi:hypothetical protein
MGGEDKQTKKHPAMKVYELTQDFQGLKAGDRLTGPLPLSGSHLPAYFTQENIPPPGQPGTNGFFASAVENNDELFKLIENP